jgi:hypothetical protein
MTDQTGTGTPAMTPIARSFVIIGDAQPGEVIKIIFLTVEQARELPTIPPDALQIAIAPAGGL